LSPTWGSEEDDVGGRLQEVPAERAAVEARGARDGEVAVHEGADPLAAAGEVGPRRLGHDGVGERGGEGPLGDVGVRKVVHRPEMGSRNKPLKRHKNGITM
jgi:hypothetical protein